jgi:hypothetical protein
MEDDSTPIGSRQEAGGEAQRAPGDGDDADGGAEHLEDVLLDVMGQEAESATNQQVQHLSHFLFMSVISFFLS